MGFTGLKTYPYNISPSRAGGRDWKKRSDRNEKMRKRRSDWEDESGSDIKTGIECGAKGDVRRDRDHSNLSECVCVCVFVHMWAHGHLCFSAYVTRLSVFVPPHVIVCHCLCERLSVSTSVWTSGVCVTRTYVCVAVRWGGGVGGGGGRRRRAASRGRRDMI